MMLQLHSQTLFYCMSIKLNKLSDWAKKSAVGYLIYFGTTFLKIHFLNYLCENSFYILYDLAGILLSQNFYGIFLLQI